jgi:hypothetical protein
MPPPIAQLPAFRDKRASFIAEVNGNDTFDRSLNAIDSGTAVELISGANEISWGIWKFHPGMEAVSSVQVVMTLPAGNKAYIALADFSVDSWAFHGPVSGWIAGSRRCEAPLAARQFLHCRDNHRRELGDGA